MKRRTFLSTVAAGTVMAKPQAGTERQAISVVTPATVHPRVEIAVEQLSSELRALQYTINRERDEDGGSRSRGQHESVVIRPSGSLSAEQFTLTAKGGQVMVEGGDSRGLVYGISRLRREMALGRSLPHRLALREKPAFRVRRWSTSVSHHSGSPWDERVNLAQRFAFIKSEILPRAADFGMESIEINGRPGDGFDIAWMVGFEKYGELAALYPRGERGRRLKLVEDLARAAHDNLLGFLVWNHELYLPPGFVELYPQVKGVDYPVCLSNDFLKKFIRDKYVEFFEGVPSADGVVMSVNESGEFSLLTDAGCKCDRCRRMTQHERLMAVLSEVIDVCSALKKQIVVRTFQAAFIHELNGHPELETIRRAFTGLPGAVQVMSKYCPLDFYGGEIADEPLIGAFPNPHLVEFSLDVEWQGRTFVPVLTPENFRRRIQHALQKKCAGIVARVDFPFVSMEPEPIFGHPNEFNAWYMGELLWEPEANIDDSLARWTKLTYGPDAAPFVAPALRKTEAITQKTFFTLGQTVINSHNMIASVSESEANLWHHAFSKWDPSKRSLSASFFQPDADLIRRAKEEKREAIAMALEALEQIRRAQSKLPLPRYERLRYQFEKLRDTAELWAHLAELYLLYRQTLSTGRESDEAKQPLLVAVRAALLAAVAMEHLHGRDCWPVGSVISGNITAYQFVHEVLRGSISRVTGEPAKERVVVKWVDTVYTTPVIEPDSVESFWRKLVECGRPGFQYSASTPFTLRWPHKLREINLGDSAMLLATADEQLLRLPLPYQVKSISIQSGGTFLISKSTKHLEVQP